MHNFEYAAVTQKAFGGSLFSIEKVTVINCCNTSDSVQGNILLEIRKYI